MMNAIAALLCLLAWCMECPKCQPAEKNNAFVLVIAGCFITGLTSLVLVTAVCANGTTPQKLLAVASLVVFFSFLGLKVTWWPALQIVKSNNNGAIARVLTHDERQREIADAKALLNAGWGATSTMKVAPTAFGAFKAMKRDAVLV